MYQQKTNIILSRRLIYPRRRTIPAEEIPWIKLIEIGHNELQIQLIIMTDCPVSDDGEEDGPTLNLNIILRLPL